MKKNIFAYIIIASLLTSCNKENSYKSITGIWRCEELNPIEGTKLYNVDIERKTDGIETFILNNFHNLGNNKFVFANQEGDSIFIDQQNVFSESFSNGKGLISDDFKRIDMTYKNLDGAGKELDIQAVYIRN